MLTWWLTGCKDLNALPTEMPMWDASNTSFSCSVMHGIVCTDSSWAITLFYRFNQ